MDVTPTERHRIAFYAEGCSLRVVPGHCDVQVGDWVTFYNLHKDPIIVLVPSEELFGTSMFRLESRGSSEKFEVMKGAMGCYPFLVYDPATRRFGHASLPRIIVYPVA
jgi:hypothetical protein